MMTVAQNAYFEFLYVSQEQLSRSIQASSTYPILGMLPQNVSSISRQEEAPQQYTSCTLLITAISVSAWLRIA